MPLIKNIYWSVNKKYYNLQKTIHELKSLAIEITDRCNLNCEHCYMSSVDCARSEKNSTKDWLLFFDRLEADFGNKVLIQITGGEPLLREDIFEILEYLNKLGFRVTMVTNGTLLNEEKIAMLSKYVSSISISLDGFMEAHNYLRSSNVYDRVVDNIKLLKNLNFKYLTIKTTVYKKNLNSLKEFYKFIQNLNIDNWHFFAMEPIGRGQRSKDFVLSRDEYLELCNFTDKIKKDNKREMRLRFEEEASDFMYEKTCEYCSYRLCQAGISSCAVLSNGDIIKCIQDDRNKLKVEGNISKDNFIKVWNNCFKLSRITSYTQCNNHYFEKLLKK